MQTGRTEKIGNVVLDYSHYPEQDFYCDGASEDALLELVKTIPPREYPQEIYKAASWEVLYHLSDLRENIVGWLPVDKSMKVLEIGSGCGAITGSLAQKAGSDCSDHCLPDVHCLYGILRNDLGGKRRMITGIIVDFSSESPEKSSR